MTPDIPYTSPSADRRFLEEIIQTVSGSIDLERVLKAIVALLTEATVCHACYIFLADARGAMTLSACSEQYAEHVGRVVIPPGEGLAGWVATHREPVFITQDAILDPRMHLFEEFEEDKYQSIVSVPLLGRLGGVVGVVALHAVAPHSYSQSDADFLLTSASLVAGAIENAQLHADTKRRVVVLERLFALSEVIAAAASADALLTAFAEHAVPLLDAAACETYLLEPDTERLRLRGFAPARVGPAVLGLRDVGVAFGSAAPILHAPLNVSGEMVGLLVVHGRHGRPFLAEHRDLASTVAAQAATAVKKLQLLERLADRNAAKDLFDEFERTADPAALESLARRLRIDLAVPRVVLQATTGRPDDLEALIADAFRGAVTDRGDARVRALVPAPAGAAEVAERVRSFGAEAAIGLSSICQGAAALKVGLAQAAQAERGVAVLGGPPRVVSYEDLGPYKYLLRLDVEPGERDRHRDALRPLFAYDRAHRSQLVRTLEEYLRRRGRIAATAAALYVHPNTLRQRLARIESILGLELETEDALTLEMALKLLRLEA